MTGRRIKTVRVTSRFENNFQRLPPPIQKLAQRRDQWFRANAFDPRLRTHQLAGDLKGYWAYSVNQQLRILFRFVSDHEALYFNIGTHAVYR